MFERFRRDRESPEDNRAEHGNGVAVRERDRTVVRSPEGDADQRAAARNGDPAGAMPSRGGTATAERTERRPVAERAAVEAQVRRREEFGGLNWGAAFFGWLVATGLAALLVGIVAAAGAAIGLVEVSNSEVQGNAEAIGIVGGALLVGILVLAYFAGGYVAGRMSRFDGARQGAGVWVIGLLTTIALAIAGVIGGSEYNVYERLDLPRIPIDEGDLTTGGAIALGAVLVGTLLGSMLGGKAGERYHRRVDAAAWDVR
jgi:hypothetical protein